MRKTLFLATLLLLAGCPEEPPPPPSQPRAWYSGGTLTNATVARWNSADDHNRLATSLDLVADRLMQMGAPPNRLDMEAMRPYAERLRDCLVTAAQGAGAGETATIPDLAATCLDGLNLTWPLSPPP